MELRLGWSLDISPPGRLPINLYGPGLRRHCALIAQSGSGKSFALGRLVEEVASKTKARFVVLDSNGDFNRFSRVNTGAWASPTLTPWFDEADSQEEFKKRWERITFSILTNRSGRPLGELTANVRELPIALAWGSLSIPEKAALLNFAIHVDPEEVALMRLLDSLTMTEEPNTVVSFERYAGIVEAVSSALQTTADESYVEISDGATINARRYRAYVGIAAAVRHAARVAFLRRLNVWAETGAPDTIRASVGVRDPMAKVTIVDLTSLESQQERMITASAVLETLWQRAQDAWCEALSQKRESDNRVPVYVVIDEAHNLAPTAPESAQALTVCEKIQRIAAEGRKYGLHLLVATQRPSKLNMSILTECDNLILMKMTNLRDLGLLEECMGFVPRGMSARALNFKTGQALTFGEITGCPVAIQVAPRRTEEGGRNLRDEAWLEWT